MLTKILPGLFFYFASFAAWSHEPNIIRAGDGETLMNGIVVKLSPESGTQSSILVEQTFPMGGQTSIHMHEQGDELFYVVSGSGTARLGQVEDMIGEGDVIFVPAGAEHQIRNDDSDEPLVVVFFMASPELVRQFRAVHERMVAEPSRPITPAELAELEARIGGGKTIQ